MSTYLLDTHILLWWLSNDRKLTKKVKETIANPNNTIFVSSVTCWEIVIKKTLGKLEAPNNLKEILYKNDMELLSMTTDHALYVEHLPLIHSDPFDRLLIAQSIIEDMVFITADNIIPRYKIKCLN